MNRIWKKELEQYLNDHLKGEYLKDEPLFSHTWYRIGGPADFLVYPQHVDDLRNVLQLCRALDIPTYMLGAGANLLVSDAGYRGVMINLQRYFTTVQARADTVQVMAGALLQDVVAYCETHGLGGLQGLAGIPGTIGGALTMNAGTNHGEIGDHVKEVLILDDGLETESLICNQIRFGYRSAPELQDRIIIGCTFVLYQEDMSLLRQFRIHQIAEREAKQPLDCPSCGSVFKRPPGFYVGKMVEELGLKGFRYGDAMISTKHGGFIVNCGHATAADVRYLIQKVQEDVKKHYHIALEPEVRFVGF
jgi:UDP-N-acetylmuramate dehydrogenase